MNGRGPVTAAGSASCWARSRSGKRVEYREVTLADEGAGAEIVLHLDAERVVAVGQRRGVEEVSPTRRETVGEAGVEHGDPRSREAVARVRLEGAVDQDTDDVDPFDVERPTVGVDGAADQVRPLADLDVADRVEVGEVLEAEEVDGDLVDVGDLAGDVTGTDDDVVLAAAQTLAGDEVADVEDEAVAGIRRVPQRGIEPGVEVAGEAVAVREPAGVDVEVAVAARVLVDNAVDQELDVAEIGRASCRERVFRVV